MGEITPPEPLAPSHSINAFDCGVPTLDDWLKRRALHNQASGASKTFVVTDGDRVVAYYAIATGSVTRSDYLPRQRHNMPDPIPIIVLARLAVDHAFSGKGIGSGLLKDALLRAFNVSRNVGVAALLVHAVSDEARMFYQHHGFKPSPLDPMTLMIPISAIRDAVTSPPTK